MVAPIGAVDGTDPDGTCEIVGVGPVPRRILSTLSPDTQVAGMVFDRAGRPLWLGRRQRLANTAQRFAEPYATGDASPATRPCTNANYTTYANGTATGDEPMLTTS